jgi:pimeloyl-ACP methyl ester carboxylesterase
MASRLLVGVLSLLFFGTDTPGPPSQDRSPRFERVTCDYPVPRPIPQDVNRECGYVAVPESRARPNGRMFKLAVVIYRAKEPATAPPLMLLHGGPSGVGGTRFPWGEMQFSVARSRDVVTFDNRGVGGSEPDLCPDLVAQATPAFQKPTRREWEEGYREAVRACVAQLDAQGIDRAAFGADVNAADAVDIRRALKYERWDIYGVSYGTLVAQELLRIDSPATRSAALISGVPPGPVHMADRPLARQRALQEVFTTCAADPVCRRTFPTLEADFYSLYKEFSTTPVAVNLPGTPTPVLMDGERFMTEIFRELGPPRIRRLPRLIHELRRGDREAAGVRLVDARGFQPWDALGRIVQCNEYGAGYREAASKIRTKLRPEWQSMADDFREHCDLWLPKLTRQADIRPVVSDVPTLVVHGEYDPTDIKAAQARMTARLSRAYVYTFPGEGHAGAPVGCHGSIVQQFLDNPMRAPDSSCLARMPRVRFKTTPGYAFTVTFTIATPSGTDSKIAGVWEAALAGGPDWTIELVGEGTSLRGTVLEHMLPVVEGTLSPAGLSFKVRSPDGGRIVAFVATLDGDKLSFTRTIESLAPAGFIPPGLFSPLGPTTFVAQRVQ